MPQFVTPSTAPLARKRAGVFARGQLIVTDSTCEPTKQQGRGTSRVVVGDMGSKSGEVKCL